MLFGFGELEYWVWCLGFYNLWIEYVYGVKMYVGRMCLGSLYYFISIDESIMDIINNSLLKLNWFKSGWIF